MCCTFGDASYANEKDISMPEPSITHLERRKIEGGVLIPMVQAFQATIGPDKANEIAKQVIIELAERDGERWAAQHGDDLNAMEHAATTQSSTSNSDYLNSGSSFTATETSQWWMASIPTSN
jgi:hypothetical protein